MLQALLPAIGSAISGGLNWLTGQSAADAAAAARHADVLWREDVAKNSIRWRVWDAKRAGVHPLYALGAPTMSATPLSIGMDSGVGAMTQAGQDIGRAIGALGTQAQRMDPIAAAIQEKQLLNMDLQNELLASRVRLLNQPGNPPARPSPAGNIMPGQGDTSQIITVKPGVTETSSGPGTGQAAVVVPDVAFSQTATGLSPVPSRSVKEQIEDITIPQLMWGIRNNILPQMGATYNPPDRDPGPGKVWAMHPLYGEWRAVDRDSWLARLMNPPGYRKF